MKNPATNSSRDDFNVFTEHLFTEIIHGKKPLVVLRNGAIVEVSWYDKEGPEYEHFAYINGDTYMIWENDGHSITSRDFDMMHTL